MSMTTLVVLRFAGIFAAYTGLTVLLPAIMFHRILAGRGLSEQFLMCYTFGNFYIINIVFAVQLLHISGFWALVLFTAVPGIRNDFCDSVCLLPDQFFSDREGETENQRNKAALRMLCAGFFADSGDSFLWNYDCRALLYWNCCRFLSALPE